MVAARASLLLLLGELQRLVGVSNKPFGLALQLIQRVQQFVARAILRSREPLVDAECARDDG